MFIVLPPHRILFIYFLQRLGLSDSGGKKWADRLPTAKQWEDAVKMKERRARQRR